MTYIDKTTRSLYRKLNLQKTEIAAFVSVIIFGLIAHMYFFVNKIPNHDDMHYAFGYDTLIEDVNAFNSRVGLYYFSKLSGAWSVPWLNGILSLFLIAISAIAVVRILRIKSCVCSSLIGGMMVVFPVVTSIFAYMMTADAYFTSLLFSCLAVLALTKKGIIPFLISAVLFALSISIYQAFLPFALSLFLAYIIRTLWETQKIWNAFLQLIKLVASAAISLVLYTLVINLMGAVGTRLESSEEIDFGVLWDRFEFGWECFRDFYFEDLMNFSAHSFDVAFKICTWFALILLVIIVIRKRLNWKSILATLFFGTVFVGSIVSLYVITNERIHSLMMYSFIMLPILYLMLADVFQELPPMAGKYEVLRFAVVPVLLLSLFFCWNYTITANKDYLRMDISYRQTYAFSVRLIEKIESTEGYSREYPVVFIGEPSMDEDNEDFFNLLWGKDEMMLVGSLTPNEMLAHAAEHYYPYEEFLTQYLGWHHEIYRHYAPYWEAGTYAVNIPNIGKIGQYPEEDSIVILDGVIYVCFLG